MKVSAKQKAETREAILAAAVDLFIDKGFRETSMRAVARQAGVGDATIYNYFPTKEALLYGYYQDALNRADATMRQVEGFADYDLRERMQLFVETVLEGFLPDREFVDQTFSSIFFHPLPVAKGIKSIRGRFVEIVDEMLQAATASGETPEITLKELICHFVWDYFIAVVLYWLRDDSEQFANTTVFIDTSMDLGYTLLRSGVIDKATSLASFLFKTHILTRLDLLRERRDAFQRLRQEFMDHAPQR